MLNERSMHFARSEEPIGFDAHPMTDVAEIHDSANLHPCDEFAGVVGHEIKNRLFTMKLQMERLLDDPIPGRGALLKLNRQVDQLCQLTDALTDGSRFAAGRIRLLPKSFDLSGLVQQTLEHLEDELLRSGSLIDVQLEAVEGKWDPFWLGQLISNLVSNAIKFGSRKGITIAVKRVHDHGGRWAYLTVADRGIGIPLDAQKLIFTAFERAGRTNHPGVGIGLYLTQRIAQAHGGTLEFHSTPDVITTFVAKLPCERCSLQSL